MEVKDVQHRQPDLGNSCPYVSSGALHVTSGLVLLDPLVKDFAEVSVLDQSYLFGRWVMHDCILVLDHVPVLTDAGRLHRGDKALLLVGVWVVNDLIMQADLVLLSPTVLKSQLVFHLRLNKHPVAAEFVVKHFSVVS